ncbi:MAG: allophanate hydrolase-related protein [Nocardioidaceae bacterium]
MFLNGEGMRGGSAHRHIEGSPFSGEVRTAAGYRFLSFADEFPGLLPVDHGGQSIIGELYDVPLDRLHQLFRNEPAQLELSVVTLLGGQLSFGMIVRVGQPIDTSVIDITEIGDWRHYKSAQ